ncbi:MAG: hypothetical protein WCP59_00100 [Actinomycetota bacterium]|jgi:hypothetical protein
MAQAKITRSDLESRFKALQDDVQLKVNDKKQSLASAAAVGGVVLVLIVFLLGKRSGRKKSTFVEIRRV